MVNSGNWRKFATLFGLYVAQSVPMSFFSTVVPVIMRQENYSLESIGMLQLIKLPWIFKFLWAPLVDRSAGTAHLYRRWILGSEFFYAIVILSIGFLDLSTDFRLIVILMLIAFTASATQDIATDAFAILILKRDERGAGNSMQSAGSFIGTLAGSGLLLVIYHFMGWRYLLLALSLFVVVALVPLIRFKICQPDADRAGLRKASVADIVSFFAIRGMPLRVLILTLFYAGIIGSLAMMKPYLVDFGYNVKQIGFISGIAGTSLAATAALAAGRLMKMVTRMTAMRIFAGLILAAALFLIAATRVNTGPLLISGILFIWISYGMATVGVYTTSMDWVRRGREGTDFTIQIVVTHLSSLLIAVFSGRLADRAGYDTLFTAGALAAAVSFAVVWNFYSERKGDE